MRYTAIKILIQDSWDSYKKVNVVRTSITPTATHTFLYEEDNGVFYSTDGTFKFEVRENSKPVDGCIRVFNRYEHGDSRIMIPETHWLFNCGLMIHGWEFSQDQRKMVEDFVIPYVRDLTDRSI